MFFIHGVNRSRIIALLLNKLTKNYKASHANIGVSAKISASECAGGMINESYSEISYSEINSAKTLSDRAVSYSGVDGFSERVC
jgi:hypothetical protein